MLGLIAWSVRINLKKNSMNYLINYAIINYESQSVVAVVLTSLKGKWQQKFLSSHLKETAKQYITEFLHMYALLYYGPLDVVWFKARFQVRIIFRRIGTDRKVSFVIYKVTRMKLMS